VECRQRHNPIGRRIRGGGDLQGKRRAGPPPKLAEALAKARKAKAPRRQLSQARRCLSALPPRSRDARSVVPRAAGWLGWLDGIRAGSRRSHCGVHWCVLGLGRHLPAGRQNDSHRSSTAPVALMP
jgi:hypothetical protein